MSTTISASFWFLERKVENYMETGVGTSGTSAMLFVLASPIIFRALSHTPKPVNPILRLGTASVASPGQRRDRRLSSWRGSSGRLAEGRG